MVGTSNHDVITPLHLSNSLQSAYAAIHRSMQDNLSNNECGGTRSASYNNNAHNTNNYNRKQRRRASLPADPSLFGGLKRTISHKRFPHLNPTKSIPFGFSPTAALKTVDIHHSLLPRLHLSRSHCNLPHLPSSPLNCSSRRGSLPPNFKLREQSIHEDSTHKQYQQRQRERRGSYPLTEEMLRQRQLHRCKAKHKANITLTDLLDEWKEKAKQLQSETKRVKSEPQIRRTYKTSVPTTKRNEKSMVRSSSLFTTFDIVGSVTNDTDDDPSSYIISGATPKNASSSCVTPSNNNSRHYAPSSSYLVHVHYTDSQAVRSLSKPSSIITHRRTSSILAKAP